MGRTIDDEFPVIETKIELSNIDETITLQCWNERTE